jgi:hypothetical protein
MKSKIIYFTMFGLILITSFGILSAQTPVIGKIYNSDYSQVISDASVTIYCGTNSLSTTSLNDGTYAVRFDPEFCSYPSNIRVEANKDNLAGSNNGVLVKCEDSNCTGDYLSIVNLNLKVQTPSSSSSSSSSGGSGGGSYRGYFNCGNNKCDTGETEKTCPKDCAKIIDNSTNTVISLSLPGTNNLDEIKNENTNTQENKQSNSGFWNSLGIVKTIIAVIFIVGIAIAFVAVSMNRRRNREVSKF